MFIIRSPLHIFQYIGETGDLDDCIMRTCRLGIPIAQEVDGNLIVREEEQLFSVIGKLHALGSAACDWFEDDFSGRDSVVHEEPAGFLFSDSEAGIVLDDERIKAVRYDVDGGSGDLDRFAIDSLCGEA